MPRSPLLLIEVDPQTQAMYLRLSVEAVHRTERVHPQILLDLDGDGHPVGMMVLSAGSDLR